MSDKIEFNSDHICKFIIDYLKNFGTEPTYDQVAEFQHSQDKAKLEEAQREISELRLAKPNAGSTDTLTEKYRLREKLEEAQRDIERLNKTTTEGCYLVASKLIDENVKLKSQCEKLAKALKFSLDQYTPGMTKTVLKEALAEFEKFKEGLK